MNRNIKIMGLIAFCALCLCACLKENLPKLPAYSSADITDLYSQYRYMDTQTYPDGSLIVHTVNFSVSNKSFDNSTASATVTVPDASNFTVPEERDKVSASNIVMMCNLSTGATIEPLSGAPKLGSLGDYSKPQQYKVTAADGITSKIWTISVLLVK